MFRKFFIICFGIVLSLSTDAFARRDDSSRGGDYRYGYNPYVAPPVYYPPAVPYYPPVPTYPSYDNQQRCTDDEDCGSRRPYCYRDDEHSFRTCHRSEKNYGSSSEQACQENRDCSGDAPFCYRKKGDDFKSCHSRKKAKFDIDNDGVDDTAEVVSGLLGSILGRRNN